MFGVIAAAEGSQKETAVLFRIRREMQFKEESSQTGRPNP